MANTFQDTTNPLKKTRLMRPGCCRFHSVFALLLHVSFCLALALQFCGQAHGSCGDYLQHGPTDFRSLPDGVTGAPDEASPNAPTRDQCRHGNCRGQLPAHFPMNDSDKIRRDDHRSGVKFSFAQDAPAAHGQFGNAVDEHLPSQAVLEVNVPPPRL